MYGNPETTSGGNALKFYASVRIDVRAKEKIEGENKQVRPRLLCFSCAALRFSTVDYNASSAGDVAFTVAANPTHSYIESTL